MTSLYDITEQYRLLSEMDIDEQTLADTLESIDGEFEDKAINICHVISSMERNLQIIFMENTRLKSRHDAVKKRQQSLKDYLRDMMVQTENYKIVSPLFTISTIKPRDKVVILDASKLSENVLNSKIVITPDKKLIKELIDSGEKVSGAILTKGEYGIKIK